MTVDDLLNVAGAVAWIYAAAAAGALLVHLYRLARTRSSVALVAAAAAVRAIWVTVGLLAVGAMARAGSVADGLAELPDTALDLAPGPVVLAAAAVLAAAVMAAVDVREVQGPPVPLGRQRDPTRQRPSAPAAHPDQ